MYGPLFAELKALQTIFSKAKSGKAPVPQFIDNGVSVDAENIRRYDPRRADTPTLTEWPQLRKSFHDHDFKPKARDLLEAVDDLTTTYNNAVVDAKQAAIPILASHMESAIAILRNNQNWGATPQPPTGWFDRFVNYHSAETQNEATRWLKYWPDGQSLTSSLVMGWLLAGKPDEAASYVQRYYPAEGVSQFSPPPLDWIQAIFEHGVPELEKDPAFLAATKAKDTLVAQVQDAVDKLDDVLLRIQKRFEGGEPLI